MEKTMEKRDYRKRLKHLYGPSVKKVEMMEVPQMNFLMIDGEEDPNTPQSFNDLRRAAPEKWKAVVRQPMS
jgi:hypothetical protein